LEFGISVLLVRVRGSTEHAPRAHLKGTMHQDPRGKSNNLFMEKYTFPEKCLTFYKISAQFLAKNFVPIRSPIGLNHKSPQLALISRQSVHQRSTMVGVGEGWIVFTIRVLVEKDTSGSPPSL